ncbi:MAG TPA: TonB-dependent siderophore receptor [Vicinamibacterales bacterium]|nr:TonB-dependent siderophore receptor [Vicinamibacterales bacterium]
MPAALLLALAVAVSAPFTLSGRVVDAMGAPLAGANIAAVCAAAPPRTAATNPRGEFTLILPPGHCTVTVAFEGFASRVIVIDAADGGRESRDVMLQIAGVQEAVSVSAAMSPLDVTAATKTATPLRDVPQSVTVVPQAMMRDQLMTSIGQVVEYVPGIAAHQGENNRDQIIVRGNSSSADFFVNGVRDDMQYYRDVYNLDRIEALKGPNALIFGRGGAGGVINRVTKAAGFSPLRELTVQGGMFDNGRVTAGVDQPLNDSVALRLDGMFEHAGSFRDHVNLDRYGVTPTMTIVPDARTTVTLRYEYLHDARVADRGIPSFAGRPAGVDVDTYFGNPDDSRVRSRVNIAAATVERRLLDSVVLRNQTLVGNYDRFYQNFVPGAVNAAQTLASLSAYNNASNRTNVFNQTDLTARAATGAVRHTLLVGAELGRQLTDNFRQTGFFNGTATSVQVPYADPTISLPVTFRQNATDADNHVTTSVAAAYVQDQVELSRHLQLVGGLRFDRFDLEYHNNRNGDTLERPDNLVSPRAGIIVKPMELLSIYTSYSVSYLPSSGDQFSSLTAITQQAKPEKFNNYEVGVKWDVRPRLSLTTAVYRLDRTNTRATDPNDPTRIVQTGSQRTNGYELGLNGAVSRIWSVSGGYAYQDAFVTSATTAAVAGAQVAQVPHHTFSLWNLVQLHPRVSAGLGIVSRSDMFAAIDDTVTLPAFARVDAAVYVPLAHRARLQVNAENLFNRRYYANADNNTNISPGSPRAVRVGLTTSF